MALTEPFIFQFNRPLLPLHINPIKTPDGDINFLCIGPCAGVGPQKLLMVYSPCYAAHHTPQLAPIISVAGTIAGAP